MLSFKPKFSLSSFTLIKRLFSSSLLSAVSVGLSAYLRLLIFLPAILIPACASSSPTFLMMYSSCKLNKQDDNRHQLMYNAFLYLTGVYISLLTGALYIIHTHTHIYVCVCAQSLSCVRLFVTLWTVACQASPCIAFPRQEYWSRLPFTSPRDLPRDQAQVSHVSALAGGFFTLELTGKPICVNHLLYHIVNQLCFNKSK